MSPEARHAMRRMMRLVASLPPNSIAAWNQRTSMDDARIALQLALGHAPEQISRQGYLLADLAGVA